MRGSSGIRVAKVPNAGTGSVPTQLLVQPSGGILVAPGLRVAGTEGRYLLVHAVRHGNILLNGVADDVRTVRFDWPNGAASPTVLTTRVLASTASSASMPFRYIVGGLEHDLLTKSHWAFSYKGDLGSGAVVRLGFSGGVVEGAGNTGACDVAFALSGTDGSFPVVGTFGANGAWSIRGNELTYPANALSVPYGASCAGPGVVATSNRPFAGHEFFRVRLLNVQPGAPCIFVLSAAPGTFDLTPLGFTGCTLNVALPALATLNVVADGGGDAQVVFALPDEPALIGDVFSQWFYFDPAAAPVPFRAHSGLRHQIR
jgi:hypothetical protein